MKSWKGREALRDHERDGWITSRPTRLVKTAEKRKKAARHLGPERVGNNEHGVYSIRYGLQYTWRFLVRKAPHLQTRNHPT